MLEQFNDTEFWFALKTRVNIARQHAISPEEYIDSEQKNLDTAQIFDRDATARELQEILNNPRYVVCKDPSEYQMLTRLIPEIASSYTHELAHYTTATAFGFKPIFGIFFVYADDNHFQYYVQSFVLPGEIPKEMDEIQYFEAIKSIIAAPSNPSPSDMQMLAAR